MLALLLMKGWAGLMESNEKAGQDPAGKKIVLKNWNWPVNVLFRARLVFGFWIRLVA